MEFGFLIFSRRNFIVKAFYVQIHPSNYIYMYPIWTLCVFLNNLNVNQTMSLACSNPLIGFLPPLEWNLSYLTITSCHLSRHYSPHLTLLDHTILTTSVCFLFLRPSFFCFRDLYLLSPLPRRHFFQTSRVHTLTLFKFLSTWNLFGEILLTTLSKIISTLPVVSFSSWSCILSQIYLVSCLLSVYTWL